MQEIMQIEDWERELKRQLRAELRSALNTTLGEMIVGADFDSLTYQLWILDDVRGRVGHWVRSRITNDLIKQSTLSGQIHDMRKDKSSDRKKIAALIKKALKEVGYTEPMITTARDKALAKMPIYQLMDIAKTETTKALLSCFLDQDRYPVYSKLWRGYLQKVTGISVLTAAKLIYIIKDATRFSNPSKLIKYLGLHVKDGKAVHRRRGQEANFNPKGQSLVLGVVAPNFLKSSSQYRKIYDERKAKTMETRPEWGIHPHGKDKTYMAHYHADAQRVMAKRFIIEFWKAWWQATGQEPPTKPYAVRILGHDEERDIVAYG